MSDTIINDPRVPQEIRDKFAAVDLGMEAQQFLGTRIGKYLVARAEQEVDAGVEKLKTIDVMGNPRAALLVQCEIARAESFLYWMAEIISAGAEATTELIETERQEQGLDPPDANTDHQ